MCTSSCSVCAPDMNNSLNNNYKYNYIAFLFQKCMIDLVWSYSEMTLSDVCTGKFSHAVGNHMHTTRINIVCLNSSRFMLSHACRDVSSVCAEQWKHAVWTNTHDLRRLPCLDDIFSGHILVMFRILSYLCCFCSMYTYRMHLLYA